MVQPIENSNLAVYTVLLGQVSELNPIVDSANVDWICFTDQDLENSNGWQIRKISSVIPGDLPRSSRHPKILPHHYLSNYSKSLYVDSSVELTGDPNLLFSYLVPSSKAVFGAFYHSRHETLLLELVDIVNLGFESSDTITRTVGALNRNNSKALEMKPVWGGILARRHNEPSCISIMKIWLEWVFEYSRRDQASLPAVLQNFEFGRVNLVIENNQKSEFHNWPVRGYVKPAHYSAARGNELPNWQSWIPKDLQWLVRSADAIYVRERDSLIRERDSLTSSFSWKFTSPLRSVGRLYASAKKKKAISQEHHDEHGPD